MTLPATVVSREPCLRVAIHQPNFLPRLKVLQKLAYADVWCVLDSVQYCSREWQNRARVVAAHGDNKSFWLAVPVHRPKGSHSLIREVTIACPSATPQLIERTLFHALHRAPHWEAIEALLSTVAPVLETENLEALCVGITNALLGIVGRQPNIVLASSLPVTGEGSSLMAEICRYLGATTYLADSGGRNYLEPSHFNDVEVAWQNWSEPPDPSPGINSWRDVAGINYIARYGPERFAEQLLCGKFTRDHSWGYSAPCVSS
jgi:hypothetical protein